MSSSWFHRARGMFALLGGPALWAVAIAAGAHAQPQAAPDAEGIHQTEQLFAWAARTYDWDREYQSARLAIEKIWDRHHWATEPHRFARDLALEVAKIPPWQLAQRFERFNGQVGERYRLTETQQAELRGALLREGGSLMVRHGPLVVTWANEMLKARLNGKPFTAEQIARWTTESDELVADAKTTASRLVTGLRAGMDEGQRETLDQDFEAFEERMRGIESMREVWRAGGWRPEQWGMEADPIQNGAGNARRLAATGAAPVPMPPAAAKEAPEAGVLVAVPAPPLRWDPNDPHTWSGYVAAQERKYGFDDGQTTTAESIHRELFDRAVAYLTTGQARGGAAVDLDRAPVRRLFDELTLRIDAIVRGSQRRPD